MRSAARSGQPSGSSVTSERGGSDVPDALDRAITSASSSSEASFEEAVHELGITTEEGTALAVAVFEQADSPSETLVIALLAGLLVGRELGRPRGLR